MSGVAFASRKSVRIQEVGVSNPSFARVSDSPRENPNPRVWKPMDSSAVLLLRFLIHLILQWHGSRQPDFAVWREEAVEHTCKMLFLAGMGRQPECVTHETQRGQ